MAGFELSKWYADCTTEAGDAAILYHARMRWRSITFHYSSLITYRSGSVVESVYSLRRQAAPTITENSIHWRSTQWQLTGDWSELGQSCRDVLYESDSGILDWHCMAPRTKANLQIKSMPKMEGWGYVEHLRLTIPPWKLPIRRLRWGRFVNATDAVVWIDWEGTYSMQLVFWNGSKVNAAKIEDDLLILGEDAVLTLDRGVVLRDGVLGSTALSVIPNLGSLFPDSVLHMRECKWLSKAILRRSGHPESIGMAIHEVVEWP